MEPTRHSAGDPSRLNRVASRRSSLRFGPKYTRASCCANASPTGTPMIRIAPPVRERRPPVGTARRRRAESRIAKRRDGSRLGTVLIPGGDAPARERRSPSVLPVGARHRGPQGRESPFVDVHGPAHASWARRRRCPAPSRELSVRVSPRSAGRCRPEVDVPVPTRRSAWWLGRRDVHHLGTALS